MPRDLGPITFLSNLSNCTFNINFW